MDLDQIKKHWENWAAAGVDVRATTKTSTIKYLEIDALRRALAKLGVADGREKHVLEVGCGNGHNCVALAQAMLGVAFDGVDYVPAMVDSATSIAMREAVGDRCKFFVGDMLKLDGLAGLAPKYDAVFTDRAIINLNTTALQFNAITQLANRVVGGGALLILENFHDTYDRQNAARSALGLQPRTPDKFNKFLNGKEMDAFCRSLGLEPLFVDDFGSLHDLLLYVLVPAINGGNVDYSHPIVEAATRLSATIFADSPGCFGSFGQNRLYVYRKPI